MRRLSRDAMLLVGVSILLVILTIFAVLSQAQDIGEPPLSSSSEQQSGARALVLWLEELGYQVDAGLQPQFQVPTSASIALLLQPILTVSDEELAHLESWIRQGGTLILAGASPPSLSAARHFGFEVSFNLGMSDGLNAQSPLLASPPQKEEAKGDFNIGWQSEDADYFVLLADEGTPVIVSVELGDGLLILSTSAYSFSNEGLLDAGNSQLVLNLISSGGPPGKVWFDEWHHGLRGGPREVSGPVDWLRNTSAGRALLYAVLVVLVALALSGRSFGRPLRVPENRSRRPPIEYITALANLSRRAGHRQTVMDDYRHRLKRKMGYRYRLDPGLEDAEFVRQLANLETDVDTGALANLLYRLKQSQISETQMVQLAQEVSEWIKES